MADADDSPLFDEVQDPPPKEDEPTEQPEGEVKDDESKEDETKKESNEGSPASIPVSLEPESGAAKESKKVVSSEISNFLL